MNFKEIKKIAYDNIAHKSSHKWKEKGNKF